MSDTNKTEPTVKTRAARKKDLQGGNNVTQVVEMCQAELSDCSQGRRHVGRKKGRGMSKKRREHTTEEQDCWVQCDDTKCAKWRRIPKSHMKVLDPHARWYCCMNPDGDYNTCAVPEEQSLSREPYAYGLDCGELVWGKLAGWSPWPAIVCMDSENEWMLDDTDEDGDPIRIYHVVFLGKAKSWAWVPDDKIEPYGPVCTLSGRQKGPCSMRLAVARREADSLINCKRQECLELCQQFLHKTDGGRKGGSTASSQASTGEGRKRRGRPPSKQKAPTSGGTMKAIHQLQSAQLQARSVPSSTLLQALSPHAATGALLQPSTQDGTCYATYLNDLMMDELAHLEYETQADLDHIEKLLMTMEEPNATNCSKNDTNATVEQDDKAQELPDKGDPLLADLDMEMESITEGLTDIDKLLAMIC